MFERDIAIWVPEGISSYVTLEEAKRQIDQCWSEQTSYLWESREVGKDPDDTWGDGDHKHKTLGAAVRAAFPAWRKLGLTYQEAALICFELGLVLSTAVEIEDEDES